MTAGAIVLALFVAGVIAWATADDGTNDRSR
jgi:hypothetical protein